MQPLQYNRRELQNLRDPLHVPPSVPGKRRTKLLRRPQLEKSVAPMHKYLEVNQFENQPQVATVNEMVREAKPSKLPLSLEATGAAFTK